MNSWQPFITVRDIVDCLYPADRSWPQEEKNYIERAAIARALQRMELPERLKIETMADSLAQVTPGLGKPSALIILFRIGAYLHANGRRR